MSSSRRVWGRSMPRQRAQRPRRPTRGASLAPATTTFSLGWWGSQVGAAAFAHTSLLPLPASSTALAPLQPPATHLLKNKSEKNQHPPCRLLLPARTGCPAGCIPRGCRLRGTGCPHHHNWHSGPRMGCQRLHAGAAARRGQRPAAARPGGGAAAVAG